MKIMGWGFPRTGRSTGRPGEETNQMAHTGVDVADGHACSSSPMLPAGRQMTALEAALATATAANEVLRREVDELKKQPVTQEASAAAVKRVSPAPPPTSSRCISTSGTSSPSAELRRARDTICALEQRLATLQAANEAAYAEDYARTGGPRFDADLPFGKGPRAKRNPTETIG